MPSIGPLEKCVVLAIALLFFGPQRLPELGNSLGQGLREFKGSSTGESDTRGGDGPRTRSYEERLK
jgi:sec-independent protein translocase protein TatA